MDPILNTELDKKVKELKDASIPSISDFLTSADIAKIIINRSWKLVHGIKPSSVEERIYEETGELLAKYFDNGFKESRYNEMSMIPYPYYNVNAVGLGKIVRTRRLIKEKII